MKMAYLNERDLPDLGFPEIDAEHVRLVGLINNLHEASIAEQSDPVIRLALDELMSFAEKHFRDEERIMAEIGYPAIGRHRNEHQELLGRLLAFQQGGESSNLPGIVTMLDFLKSWLKVHVASEDIRLVIWYRSRRGSQPAWKVT